MRGKGKRPVGVGCAMSVTFCDCEQDGFCPRYRREMVGRMRELCAGVNVDLGTAAVFREQWAREAGAVTAGGSPQLLLLKFDQASGDAVVATAAIYSLHQAHPGRYRTAVECKWMEVFACNPDVSPQEEHALPIQMHYPAIHRSNERGIHFMQGWCEFLGSALGIDVPLLTSRPRLYFDDVLPQEGYWIICSGGKQDFTNKLWGQYNYQKVVDLLPEVQFVQVGGALDHHPALRGVCSVVGMTSLRGLFDLVRQSRGVVCGVSLLMHVAAALEKPAVIIAGGREPVQWNAYPKQHYLHTVGALPCQTARGVSGGACWRSRVIPLGDGSALDVDTCERPVNGTPTHLEQCVVPKCMTMIRPPQVAELVARYNRVSNVRTSAGVSCGQ